MRRKLSDLRVVELKQELEKRGQESKGLKGILVQRLQKILEEEGLDTSEIDISCSTSDTASPKTQRRSTSRYKRNTGEENGQSQDDEKDISATVIATEEKSEETATASTDGVEGGKIEGDVDGSGFVEMEAVSEEIQPMQMEDEYGMNQPDDEGDVEHPSPNETEEEGLAQVEIQEMNQTTPEDVEIEQQNIEDEMTEGKDNNYRVEEDHILYTGEVEEQVTEIQEAQLEDEEYIEEQEEGGESESEAVEESELTDEAYTSRADVENNEYATEEMNIIENEGMQKIEQVQAPVEEIVESAAPDTEIKVPAERKKTDSLSAKDPDVMVSNEEDVLDMLDYDLEITGDHPNLNGATDENPARSGERGDRREQHKATKTGNDEVKSIAATDKMASSDSSNKASSSNTGGEQPKAGSQSSAKSSSSSASKDGGKSTPGGRRDNTGASTSKKDDNLNKNLWISGLSSTTRASELKSAFSRYGKVIGAKVVTNVKSPGSRCYGYVTMATMEAANKCILHLNNTEMHGRMITVEIAKGDPSASSKKAGSGSAKKDADSKDGASKSKDTDQKAGSSSRRSSTAGQMSKSNKDEKLDSKEQAESKSSSEQQDKEIGTKHSDEAKRLERSKSPGRGRAERNSTSGSRSGDKRGSQRSPPMRSTSRSGYGKDEPERKRLRQPDSADRKVVMDSHKGELRVNVSGSNRTSDGRNARWEGENRQKPLLSRRRSSSPVRRRDLSPVRGQVVPRSVGMQNRTARGDFRNRKPRGRGGLASRTSSTSYQDRNLSTGFRGQRSNQIMSFNHVIRAQRDRDRVRPERGGHHSERGGRSDRGRPERGRMTSGRGGYSQSGQLHAERDRLRREREERDRLRMERERLERERRQLEKDRQERERLEQERLRLEHERKRELERIEREKAEMRRLQEITRYEVEQRQRAIKRTYDDDSSSHRGNRSSNRDNYDSKRVMMSDRDMRTDGRRGDRDDRRGFEGYSSRDSSRNAPAASPTSAYRSNQNNAYRSSAAGGHGKTGSASYHHETGRRGPGAPSDAHHDTDARYSSSSGPSSAVVSRNAAGGSRNVEKYDRRDGNRTIEYGHGYERNNDARHVDDSSRRRVQPREAPNHRDGRKVITREKPDHRSGSPEYRRSRPVGARVEITRETSPPAHRARRETSPAVVARAPPGSSRAAAWRDPKTSSRREDDRDLREQIRGRQVREGSSSYTATSRDRERGSQRRAASSHADPDSDSDSSDHSGGQYSARWPAESAESSATQQIYAVSNSTSAIPAQTGRSGSAASWNSWAQGVAQGTRAGWAGATIPAAGSAVSRTILPPTSYGAVPSAQIALQPPGTTIIPVTQGYIAGAERQSRSSFPASYKQITRRY